MATTVESGLERFSGGGMALLPWTKQILTVLWDQLRLLIQVIYYTFISVFQMFRFEVHVRITDETGEHIQHMGTASNTPESFLFSSLFDGDNGVMVGGSNPLSNFCADVGDPFAGKSTAEALLSSLRADDLCCGLVDDFVSRTAGKEEGILLGHKSTWKMGFPGDWNIFVSSSDSCGLNDTCHRRCDKVQRPKEKISKQETSEEDRSSQWSSEEEQNFVEFESEESKELWESLSKSSDPYNPFFFSACISTNSDMGKSKSDVKTSSSSDLKASEEMLGPPQLNMWVCLSDSESSWAGSECSSPDIDKEESDKLWEFFSRPEDPYNPMYFTASTTSNPSLKTKSTPVCKQASLPAPLPKSDAEEKQSNFSPFEDDDEELLWKSLGQKDDPYHPLNFQTCLHSSSTSLQRDGQTPDPPATSKKQIKASKKSRADKPALPDRKLKKHYHPDKTVVPWKRPEQASQVPPEGKKENKASTRQKKVQFSPLVQVHVMRTWPFARQASRKGHWEELARDRDRFRRRIFDTESAIGHCFTQPHREKIRAYLDSALNQTKGPEL
ncbi:protein phosphatase 1 regulatory subunit 15B [Girardinichthys multiradiatus]|uniref:protein phosphatase 1 regulatory subunit 15B n=1 Tax=Girardinichthys multiradiatus TaxID=208333 RepID=UPI001FAD6400|nr:protein phosphatase 1 regulatory subunit 15B [Girardinichthys multiradiatus]